MTVYCACQRGWFWVDENEVRPCERCKSDTYDQWKSGHYTPKWDRPAHADATSPDISIIKLADMMEEHNWLAERKKNHA